MHKQYANAATVVSETRIIELSYKRLGGLTYKRLPPKCQADFALLGEGGAVVGIVEVKSRQTLSSEQFSTYRVSLNKLIALKQWAQFLPTYLVVEFSDSIRVWKITKSSRQVTEMIWGGRKDRHDPNDMEIMAALTMKSSRPLLRRRK